MTPGPDPLVFPRELARCLKAEGCGHAEFAGRLLAGPHAQSLVRFRVQPDAFADDHAWLVDCIKRALFDVDWPIEIPADVFIPTAAQSLLRAFLVEWRLTAAAALDTLRASDPQDPNNPAGP